MDLLHYFHILAATVFVGSSVFFDWALSGALMKMDPSERQRTALALRPFSGPLIMGSLAVTLITGIGQLLVMGAVTEFGDLCRCRVRGRRRSAAPPDASGARRV